MSSTNTKKTIIVNYSLVLTKKKRKKVEKKRKKMDLEIKSDQVDLDQSMYYMQMSLPSAAPVFDMNRYQYQQNYPGAIFSI